jgi:hypothetical protein
MISPSLTYLEYEALPGLRWSALRHMGDSPRHCRHAERTDGDTASRVLLRAIHAGVLEGRTDHLVYDGVRRGKAYDLFDLLELRQGGFCFRQLGIKFGLCLFLELLVSEFQSKNSGKF